MNSIGIIGGADGPTSVFVTEDSSIQSFLSGLGVGIIVGALIVAAVFGIIYLVKKNRKK